MKHKKQVLFVGSFKSKAKDGTVGGQMFACRSLINSNISDKVDWLLVDSTADSNIIQTKWKRLIKACKRLFLFLNYLVFRKVDTCLIFTADGLSFVEKGIMVLLSKVFQKKTILAPRSGVVINDINNSRFMRYYIPFILKRADFIICQGESWRRFYFGLVGSDEAKFITIQNWIDTSEYFILDNRNSENIVNVLFLAWVEKSKGIIDLINAAYRLDNSNIFYHIAGDGNAMAEAKKLVDDYSLTEKFIFYSWVHNNQKLQLLGKTNIYVLPSYFEGFPNALMEAMASKCAVVATRVGGIVDLIENKENGLLFDAGDVNSLAENLKLLADDKPLREMLALNARNTISRNNTIDIAVEKMESLLI